MYLVPFGTFSPTLKMFLQVLLTQNKTMDHTSFISCNTHKNYYNKYGCSLK